ncbi:unnamed protein product [Symbiodinium natans]|uniref:RNase III domain-containing protein n=1 Tax=Symbiodinium natans TaxID=878477 RepID=A0A812KSB8_9DINO|nr:unnamed protein product [Symbiodinium natans]
MCDELTAFLLLLPGAGAEVLPFAVLLPADDCFDWSGEAIPLQWRLKIASKDDSELIALQLQQAWPLGATAWTPTSAQLQSLHDFARETFSLVAETPASAFPLLAPLIEGRASAEDGPSWAEKVLDSATLCEVAAHSRGHRPEQSSLLEMSLRATGKSRSDEESNLWLARHIATTTMEGPLAELLRGSPDGGYLVTSRYARRSHRLLRAWPGHSAAKAALATGRKKAQTEPAPGSLLLFLQERYGLEVSDAEQCIVEAADGPALRPLAAGCGGGHAVTSLSEWLMEGGGGHLSRADGSDTVSPCPSLHSVDDAGTTMGPIRLLPEFLAPHPLPPRLQLAFRLLPVVLQKLRRLEVLFGLRRQILPSLSSQGTRSEFTFELKPVFQRPSYDTTGRRHALCSERLHFLNTESRRLKQVLEEESVAMHLSPVEADWALEVATTFTSASEPYDSTRLAWLGDAAVFLIATAWTSLEADHPLQQRQRRVAALISNRCLARLALSGLELPRYLQTDPVGSRGAKQPLGKKAPADAMEALLGALVLAGGLSAAAQLLRKLSWFDSEDGSGSLVPAGAPETAAGFLGAALVRFSCSAWLVSNYPQLAADGLSDLRQKLLSATLPAIGLRQSLLPHQGTGHLANDTLQPEMLEQLVGEAIHLPLGDIHVALSELWTQLEPAVGIKWYFHVVSLLFAAFCPGQPLEPLGEGRPNETPAADPSSTHEGPQGGADAEPPPEDPADKPEAVTVSGSPTTILAGVLPANLAAMEKGVKEVEESSLSLSGLIPPMGHPPSLREASAFVGAAKRASLKQPLKFDNVQDFIVDCLRQTNHADGSDTPSSVADKEKDDDELLKVSSAEEELARLKVETMRYMVTSVKYSLGESLHTSRVIYFTNDQALKVSPVQMPMVREALGIHEPKLVIRLVPCQKGRTYWEGRPAIKNILPTKANPELEGHEQLVETDLNLIAREVLLPVAMKTHALIVGTSSCSLTRAFAEVSAPIQRRYGEACPFRMVIFEHAWNLHVRSTMKSDSVEHILKEKSTSWSNANFVKALSHKFGCDPAFWPQQKLVKGAAAYMVFECLNEERLHDSRAAVQFENMFITSLHTYLPVLALWTNGDLNTLSPQVANHVTCGIPLIIMDSRHHDLVDADDVEPADDGLESRFGFSDPSMQETVRKLSTLGKALNKRGLYDMHIASALSCVRTGVNNSTGGSGPKTRLDRNHWLYDAIVDAMVEAAHGDPPPGLDGDDNMTDLDGGEELISKATEFFLSYVGDQTYKEAQVNTSRMEEAIRNLEACTTWQELEETWKPESKKLHNAIAHNGWDKVTMEGSASAEGVPVILARPRNEFLPTGFFKFELNRELEQMGVSVTEAQRSLLAHLRKWLRADRDYDAKTSGPKRLLNDKKKWLAVYDILKTGHVHSCSLSDYRSLKHLIQKLSRSERLPDSSSLEALLLLRCAWTLADIFNEKAAQYKFWAKMAYATLLLMGVVVVVFTTAQWTVDVPDQTKKYVVLGLGLGSSSLAAWITFTDPGRKWLKLRSGSQMLQAEIWRFRTRVGAYATTDMTHFNVGRAEAERRAEQHFQKMIVLVADTVLSAKVLVSSNTTTDDVCIRFEGTRQHLEEMIHARLSQYRLTSAHFKHKQYQRATPEDPPNAEDSHHAPASPDDYIAWRLSPLLRFYQKRIPTYQRRRLLMQALFMISTTLTAVLSAADQTSWTAIVVSISSALGSWQEFSGVDKKLERYGSVVGILRNMMLWWQTLPDVDKANIRHIENLVERTENAAYSELSAWLSEAQQARELAEKAASREQGKLSEMQQKQGAGREH